VSAAVPTAVPAALHAEWTKLRTLPSNAWAALLLVAGTVAVGGGTAAVTTTGNCPPGRCDTDLAAVSLTGVYAGQNVVVVLAVLAVTGEYATQMIATTLTASPRRAAVCAAKVVVVTVFVLVTSAVAVLGSVVAARFILPGNGYSRAAGHPPLSLSDATTLRSAGGTVLYLGLIAVLCLGVGLAVRDTAGAITIVLAGLYLVPLAAQAIPDAELRDDLLRLAPMTAGLAIQATRDLAQLPIGPWAGLGVLAAYAAGALLLGAVLFQVRDA
jgi:ABC-2 type transport system permease protein